MLCHWNWSGKWDQAIVQSTCSAANQEQIQALPCNNLIANPLSFLVVKKPLTLHFFSLVDKPESLIQQLQLESTVHRFRQVHSILALSITVTDFLKSIHIRVFT
jgi:hypothetical protein